MITRFIKLIEEKTGHVVYPLVFPRQDSIGRNDVFLTYRLVTGGSTNNTIAHDGDTGLRERTVQISVFSQSYGNASKIIDTLDDLFNGYRDENFNLIKINAPNPDQHDQDTQMNQRGLDFTIKYKTKNRSE